jgi:hypothetical protein
MRVTDAAAIFGARLVQANKSTQEPAAHIAMLGDLPGHRATMRVVFVGRQRLHAQRPLDHVIPLRISTIGPMPFAIAGPHTIPLDACGPFVTARSRARRRREREERHR